jgi:hypothetical protein
LESAVVSEVSESTAVALLENQTLSFELAEVEQRLNSFLNHSGWAELVILGAPVAFLLAYCGYWGLTSWFRYFRIMNLRARLNWLIQRRGELGALGARPQAQARPRVYLGLRRRRFQNA